jgi:hypothetical protein
MRLVVLQLLLLLLLEERNKGLEKWIIDNCVGDIGWSRGGVEQWL